MDEKPVLFGSDARLVGILSTPSPAPAGDVACLMLNVGVTHRIGPHRMNVKLARHLAHQGVVSLRFDLSGIGDSPVARQPAHFREQVLRDMIAALNYLEATTGIRRFVVFGICSGAMNGFSLALQDERVVGLLMFDGYAYPSRQAKWVRNWHRLRALPGNPAITEKTVRWIKRILGGLRRQPTKDIFAADTSGMPSPAEFAEGITALQARDVALYLIYSGTLHATDRGRAQLGVFGDAEFVRRLRYEFMADVDHTVLPIAAQRKLIAAASEWIAGVCRRPAPHAAPESPRSSFATASPLA